MAQESIVTELDISGTWTSQGHGHLKDMNILGTCTSQGHIHFSNKETSWT